MRTVRTMRPPPESISKYLPYRSTFPVHTTFLMNNLRLQTFPSFQTLISELLTNFNSNSSKILPLPTTTFFFYYIRPSTSFPLASLSLSSTYYLLAKYLSPPLSLSKEETLVNKNKPFKYYSTLCLPHPYLEIFYSFIEVYVHVLALLVVVAGLFVQTLGRC